MMASEWAARPAPLTRPNHKRLNILVVARRTATARADESLAGLAVGLAQRGHKVLLASPFGEIAGTVHVPVGELRRAIRGEAIDIAHVDSPEAALAVWLARGRLPIPIVGSAGCAAWWSSPFVAWSLNLACDRVACRADHVADLLVAQGLARAKAVTVHDGISTGRVGSPAELHVSREEIRAKFGIPPDASVVATVAARGDVKGPILLLEAVGRLDPPSRPRVLVAAEDAIRAQIEASALALGLASHVFIGPVDGWKRLLAASDLFSLPDAGTSCAVHAILEAMAAGLPVIASAVPGVSETVIHGGTGFLVHPRDTGGLGKAISRLVADPGLGQRMGRFGRDVALADFSVDAMCGRYEAVYSELLAGAGRRRSESFLGGADKIFESATAKIATDPQRGALGISLREPD